MNSAKSRSENYCLSKAGFGCQYETSYVEEEENLQDLEEKADEVLPQPSLPSSVPDTPKKNGVLGEVKKIMEQDKSKPGPTDNGFVPSLSDRATNTGSGTSNATEKYSGVSNGTRNHIWWM